MTCGCGKQVGTRQGIILSNVLGSYHLKVHVATHSPSCNLGLNVDVVVAVMMI